MSVVSRPSGLQHYATQQRKREKEKRKKERKEEKEKEQKEEEEKKNNDNHGKVTRIVSSYKTAECRINTKFKK